MEELIKQPEEQQKEIDLVRLLKSYLPKTKKEWIWFLLIIAVVITLGLVSFNALTDIVYKYELLQTPCNLCYALQFNNGSYANINFSNLTIVRLNPS